MIICEVPNCNSNTIMINCILFFIIFVNLHNAQSLAANTRKRRQSKLVADADLKGPRIEFFYAWQKKAHPKKRKKKKSPIINIY